MYGIFTYIWLIYMVNVGRYTIHGPMGTTLPYQVVFKKRKPLFTVHPVDVLLRPDTHYKVLQAVTAALQQ